MMRHLTDEEIERYRIRTPTPMAPGFPEDHLQACRACRQRLERADARALERQARATFLRDNAGFRHPTLERMLAYARGEADEFDREIIEGHLEECPDCQADIRDIRVFHERQSRFPPRVYAPERASYRPASIRNWKHAPPRLFLIPLAGATALAVILAIRAFAPPNPPAPGP